MLTITSGAEYKLREMMQRIEGEKRNWRGQYFSIHALEGEMTGKEAAKIAHNVLSTHFKGEDGMSFYFDDGDILILCSGVPKKLLDEVSSQIIYLFSDNLSSQTKESFYQVFDLSVHWSELEALCAEKVSSVSQNGDLAKDVMEIQPMKSMLEDVEQEVSQQAFKKRSERETPCILIVEDDPLSQRMAKNSLKEDFSIITAENGANAYNAYVLNAPDVVFLDIGLPDIDGQELLKKFIAFDSEAYVIMLSGNSYKEEIIKALQTGAKGFVGKPFSRDKLLQYIKKCPTVKGVAA